DQFIRGLDLYDLEALRHDLLGKILTEHAGKENAIPYRELCHYYFDPRPIRIEDKLLISGMLQQARGILQENEWFLDYAPKRGWYAVKR
ncbi:unnamed protein product, partial [marine sediment metagenome]